MRLLVLLWVLLTVVHASDVAIADHDVVELSEMQVVHEGAPAPAPAPAPAQAGAEMKVQLANATKNSVTQDAELEERANSTRKKVVLQEQEEKEATEAAKAAAQVKEEEDYKKESVRDMKLREERAERAADETLLFRAASDARLEQAATAKEKQKESLVNVMSIRQNVRELNKQMEVQKLALKQGLTPDEKIRLDKSLEITKRNVATAEANLQMAEEATNTAKLVANRAIEKASKAEAMAQSTAYESVTGIVTPSEKHEIESANTFANIASSAVATAKVDEENVKDIKTEVTVATEKAATLEAKETASDNAEHALHAAHVATESAKMALKKLAKLAGAIPGKDMDADAARQFGKEEESAAMKAKKSIADEVDSIDAEKAEEKDADEAVAAAVEAEKAAQVAQHSEKDAKLLIVKHKVTFAHISTELEIEVKNARSATLRAEVPGGDKGVAEYARQRLKRMTQAARDAGKSLTQSIHAELVAAHALLATKEVAKGKHLLLEKEKLKEDEMRADLLTADAKSSMKKAKTAGEHEKETLVNEKMHPSDGKIEHDEDNAKREWENAVVEARTEVEEARMQEKLVKKTKRSMDAEAAEAVAKANKKAVQLAQKSAAKDEEKAEEKRNEGREMNIKAIKNSIDAAAESMNSPSYVKIAAVAMSEATKQVEAANRAAEESANNREKTQKKAKLDMTNAEAEVEAAKEAAAHAKEEMEVAQKATEDDTLARAGYVKATAMQHEAVRAVARAEHQALAAAAVVEAVAGTNANLKSLGVKTKSMEEATEAEKEAAELKLQSMQLQMQTLLDKQLEANAVVRHAKRQAHIKALSLQLRREQLEAKTIMEGVANDKYEDAKDQTMAVTKEAATKQAALIEWQKIEVAKIYAKPISTNNTEASMKELAESIERQYQKKKTVMLTEKAQNLESAVAAFKVAAAEKILAKEEKESMHDAFEQAVFENDNASKAVQPALIALDDAMEVFKTESAAMISAAATAAEEQAKSGADISAAIAEAQALGKTSIEHMIVDEEIHRNADEATQEAEKVLRELEEAKHAYVFSSGVAAKAAEELENMKQVDTAIYGNDLIAHHDAAQNMMKLEATAQASAVKATMYKNQYDAVKDTYAVKEALALALKGSQMEQAKPATSLTLKAEEAAGTRLTKIKKVYKRIKQEFEEDEEKYKKDEPEVESLRDSLEHADEDVKEASYDHKYAAKLKKVLVSEELTRTEKKLVVEREKARTMKTLAEKYHTQEVAIEEENVKHRIEEEKESRVQSAEKKVNEAAKDVSELQKVMKMSQEKQVGSTKKKSQDREEVSKTSFGKVKIVVSPKVETTMGESLAIQHVEKKLEYGVTGEIYKPEGTWFHDFKIHISPPEEKPHPIFKTLIGHISAHDEQR